MTCRLSETKFGAVGGFALLALLAASARGDGGIHPSIAPGLADFFPSDSVTRSMFGKSIISIEPGISFGGSILGGNGDARFKPDEIAPDFFSLSLNANGNKLFSLSPGIAYKHQVLVKGAGAIYARVSVGPTYFDYSVTTPSAQYISEKTFGARMGFELGWRWGNFETKANYSVFTRTNGLNFDGLKLEASYKVWRF